MMIATHISRVSFEEIEAQLESYVDRAEAGETFEIMRDDKIVALLTPPKDNGR